MALVRKQTILTESDRRLSAKLVPTFAEKIHLNMIDPPKSLYY
jgi:hypothetical protein